MSAPLQRPRSSTPRSGAGWSAAISLVALGLLIALNRAPPAGLPPRRGALFAVAGLALGYLAGRARAGDARFRRAAVALALALVVVAGAVRADRWRRRPVCCMPMILTLVGAVLIMRPPAAEWFLTEETPS